MKKFFLFLLITCSLLATVSCGKDKTSDESEPTSDEPVSEENPTEAEKEIIINGISTEEINVKDSTLKWKMKNGTLYISGNGPIPNYNSGADTPWATHEFEEGKKVKDEIKQVIIGNGVTSIGEHAFSGLSSLKVITTPDSVTSIEKYAFFNCKSLKTVTLSNGLKTICEYAFSESALNSITIPDSVTSIENSAFQSCSFLQEATIGKSVSDIVQNSFYYCDSLSSINVVKGNTTYHSSGNCLIKTSTKTLIIGCKDSVIPSDGSVTTIGEKAFYCCGYLENIDIPNGVKTIAKRAFFRCKSLKKATIADSVTNISEEVFFGCLSLETVTLSNNIACIEPLTFYSCDMLKNISIPNSVKSIGEKAFYDCDSLESIDIPNGVMSIEPHAFYSCDLLISVDFSAPDGWYITSAQDDANGTPVEQSATSSPATYLKDTYAIFYWYRK